MEKQLRLEEFVQIGDKENLINDIKKRFPISKEIYFILRNSTLSFTYDFYAGKDQICPSVCQYNFTNDINKAYFYFCNEKEERENDLYNLQEMREESGEDEEDYYFTSYHLMKFNGNDIESIPIFLYKKEGIINYFKDLLCKLKKLKMKIS